MDSSQTHMFPMFQQAVHDNENEDDDVGGDEDEMSELLGEKEHLYQKILYLVMADAAYCEGKLVFCDAP